MVHKEIHLDIHKTVFKVTLKSNKFKYLMESFLETVSTYNFVYDKWKKKHRRVKDRVFCLTNEHEKEYNFSIYILRAFHNFMKNRNMIDFISHERHKEYRRKTVNFSVNPEFNLFIYQKKYLKELKNRPFPTKLVDLRMGYGKSVICVARAAKLKSRLGLLIKPTYVDKWVRDIVKSTDIKKEEIFIIQGSQSLVKLFKKIDDGDIDQYKAVIFTTKTMLNYIKMYTKTGAVIEFPYDIIPEKILSELGITTLFNDETHQEFHAVYTTILALKPNEVVGMTATLENKDKTLSRMYNSMFPPETRINGIVKYDNYINFISATYNIREPKAINYLGTQGYSQIEFEQSILKNGLIRNDYIEMVLSYVEDEYIKYRTKGDKCLVFCGNVTMCDIITSHIKAKYKKLDVRKYTQEDSFSNLMEADICVSTVLSSGTAVDIPNLITVVQTISIGSVQANKQAYGRLRDLGDKEVRYVSLHCKDIPNHVNLYNDRRNQLVPMAKTYTNTHYEKVLMREIKSFKKPTMFNTLKLVS